MRKPPSTGATAPLIPLLVADIFQLAGLFRREGERIARRVGQTQARWQVLSAASAGGKSVPQIARRLGYARQSVQRTADLLVSDGLLAYAPNPDHKRSPVLLLTTQGSNVLGKITRAAASFHVQLSRRLARTDVLTTLGVARSLCSILDPRDSQLRYSSSLRRLA